MYPVELLYPCALGAGNMAVGWLLYTLLESGIGAATLLLGALVVVAVLSEAVSRAVTDGDDLSVPGQ